MRSIMLFLTVGLGVCSAQAVVLQDFEGGDYSGSGTLIADPANPSNTVLQLALTDNGAGFFWQQVYALDLTGISAGAGVVSMDIYDYGKVYTLGNKDGARWGIEGDLNSSAIGIAQKGLNLSSDGYAYATTESVYLSTSSIRGATWFAYYWAGGPRLASALDTDTGAAVVGAVGAWTTWSFTVDADGYITEIKGGDRVYIDTSDTVPSTSDGGRHIGAMKEVWASSGLNNTFGLDGLLLDNVAYEGEMVSHHPGDANGDGAVNIEDFIVLKQNYGVSTGASWQMGDFNADGVVNIEDFIILKQNYGWIEVAA